CALSSPCPLAVRTSDFGTTLLVDDSALASIKTGQIHSSAAFVNRSLQWDADDSFLSFARFSAPVSHNDRPRSKSEQREHNQGKDWCGQCYLFPPQRDALRRENLPKCLPPRDGVCVKLVRLNLMTEPEKVLLHLPANRALTNVYLHPLRFRRRQFTINQQRDFFRKITIHKDPLLT